MNLTNLEVKQDNKSQKMTTQKVLNPVEERNKGQITTKGLANRGDLDWDEWIDYWIGKGASKTFIKERTNKL